mgnify:CR=1 FL=1
MDWLCCTSAFVTVTPAFSMLICCREELALLASKSNCGVMKIFTTMLLQADFHTTGSGHSQLVHCWHCMVVLFR